MNKNLNNKLRKIFSKHNILKILKSPLLLILLTSIFARIIYYASLKPYTLCPDSNTYFNFNENILKGQVDVSRTLIYPYFIKAIRFVFGNEGLLENIVLFQDIILLLTTIVAYYIAKNIFKNKSMVFITTLLFGCAPCLLNFTHVILTEVLSLSFFVIFFGLIILYIKKPNNKMAVIIGLATLILVMTRPSFLFLIPVIFVFFILRFFIQKKEKRKCVFGVVTLMISVVFLLGYSYLNYRQNDVFFVTDVSLFNQVGNLAQTEIYEKGNDKEIVETIKKYRKLEGTEHAWGDAALKVFKVYSAKRINDFVNDTIKNNLFEYIKANLKRAYESSGQSIFAVFATYKDNSYAKTVSFFDAGMKFFNFGLLFFIVILDFIFLLIVWIRKRDVPWLKAGIWVFVAGQTLTVIIGSPNEQWGRLMYPALFFINLIVFGYFDIFITYLKSRSPKKNNGMGREE